MKPEVRIQTDRLRAFLPRYIQATQKSVISATTTVAKTTCRELIKYTAPFNQNNFLSSVASRQAGEGALKKDINSVYMTVARLMHYLKMNGVEKNRLKTLRKLLALHNYESAENILRSTGLSIRNVKIGLFDDGQAHQKSRKSNGRVHRRVPAMIVTNSEALKNYQNEIKRRVGFSRGGWAKAMTAAGLGRNEIPAWVMRWAISSHGNGHRHQTKGLIRFRVENAVSWASKILTPQRINSALRDAEDKLTKQMQIIANHKQHVK